MPGLLTHHQLSEPTQTHIHSVDDAIQPSHPLSSPSFPAQSFPALGCFQMSQLFASGGQSTGVSGSTISTSNEHPGLIFFRMEGSKLVHMMVIFFII